jgi:sialate O-acetylesterase
MFVTKGVFRLDSLVPLPRLLTLALLAGPLASPAAVSLPPLFSDHMVFQRGLPLTIWGQADQGEKVTAFLGDREIGSAMADKQGRWKITAAAPEAGLLPDLTVKGSNTIVLKDLLAGEVWLCSGQSNMQMPMTPYGKLTYGGVLNQDEEVKKANYPEIRFFQDKWEVCTPETVKTASATSYFFGRSLYKSLNVPIGLITRAIGGSAIEFWVGDQAWTPELEAKAVEGYRPFYQRARQANPAKALAKPEEYADDFSRLYKKLIDPLAGFPVRGVLWYQGETNTERPGAYTELLTALIESWRKSWDQPDLPFIIVQLPDFKGPQEQTWPVIRAKQAEVAAAVPKVILASMLGAGEPDNLHPRNKQEVGQRAALRALDSVYRQKVPMEPAIQNIAWTDSGVKLTFTTPLVVKGEGTPFIELAGADGVYQPAQATVSGADVLVTSEKIKAPTRVRYAWLNNPRSYLYGPDNLAAAPFELKR